MSSPAEALVKGGIAVVGEATAHDSAGRRADAARLYRRALDEFFAPALRHSPPLDAPLRELVESKIAEYEARLEVIAPSMTAKALFGEPAAAQAAAATASSSSSSGSSGPPKAPAPLSRGSSVEVMSAPPAVDWSALQAAEKETSSSSFEFDASAGSRSSSTSGKVFGTLEEAMRAAEEAHAAEGERDYPKALKCYHTSCTRFMEALELEQNEATKDVLRGKVETYMKRAEVIKAFLARKAARAGDSAAGTGSAAAAAGGSSASSLRIRGSAGAAGSAPPSRGGSMRAGAAASAAAAAAATPAPKPEPLEVSPAAAEVVGEGIELFNTAREADSVGRAADAARDYEAAGDKFTEALALETNTKSRKTLNDKMVECLTRAETLRAQLRGGDLVGAARVPLGLTPEQAAAADKKKGKKSKKGKKEKEASTYQAPAIVAPRGGKTKKTWR